MGSLAIHMAVVTSVIEEIESEIKENLSIEYLSKYSGYSSVHLQRLFKEVKGISLSSYIRTRKIERAAGDIMKNRKYIVDIAVDYSFSSQASFSRTFKSIKGSTPSSLRIPKEEK